ncbi:hypothetical protein SmJEL517_g05849 [Synchytrium microbalum]|uniref:C2H2-type domain-containing protein n=1 Tax=Synchytrium microbalum TaxID=1806994 RepID=A0A507BY09_9FUNG|nr:uncharacterized protein SmJEL517_g05849 [Synchytrium microbalum]TPX30606.1 hypothetical protein SmJEL517_g05849 [Synchytrium microbalum]
MKSSPGVGKYCDRDFEDEKVLINHQKAKHLKCPNCNKKLNTAGGLQVHFTQVHKETLIKVPNAIAGRDDPNIEIFGMEGIPEADLQKHLAEVDPTISAAKRPKLATMDEDQIKAQLNQWRASQEQFANMAAMVGSGSNNNTGGASGAGSVYGQPMMMIPPHMQAMNSGTHRMMGGGMPPQFPGPYGAPPMQGMPGFPPMMHQQQPGFPPMMGGPPPGMMGGPPPFMPPPGMPVQFAPPPRPGMMMMPPPPFLNPQAGGPPPMPSMPGLPPAPRPVGEISAVNSTGESTVHTTSAPVRQPGEPYLIYGDNLVSVEEKRAQHPKYRYVETKS